MTRNSYLGEFEQTVLLAVLRCRDAAYGMRVRQEIAERTGRDVSLGAIYTTLDRLEHKGFVSSRRGAPTPARGGRSKRLFVLEAAGADALNQSRQSFLAMWEGLAAESV